MLELNKNYRTEGGHRVVLYTIQAGGEYPVHAGVIEQDGDELKMQTYNLEGKTPHSDLDTRLDIVLIDSEEGDIVMMANSGDALPTVAIFQYEEDGNFYGLVGNDKILKSFNIIYEDVPELREAFEDLNDEYEQEEAVESLNDEHEQEELCKHMATPESGFNPKEFDLKVVLSEDEDSKAIFKDIVTTLSDIVTRYKK